MFRENQEIGNYTLVEKLGRGGFGEVWLAERRTKFVTTKVAVKLPLDDQVDHEAVKQEATLWEQASGHPNILPIIDADEYDGQIVIVSEYAPDGSLEEWLKTHGKMSVEKAVETTIQILDGLEFLHSRHIIHRDLKPANILLQGNVPRLADFGISRALRTTVASQSQHISGTFAYMSPEALDGKRSVQTDVWSVGVNLYQFLTGTLPFPQKEPSVLLAAIMMREFAPLPDSIPQNLKNVIAKALAKLPENRYASANEMREDLRRILRGEKIPNFVRFDLPETQHSFPVSQILPTQKSPIIPNRKPHREVETFIRPRPKDVFKQNIPPQKSNLWMYATIVLVLFSAIGLGIYFLTNSSKQSIANRNEIAQVSVTPSNINSANSENVNIPIISNSATPLPSSTPNKSDVNVQITSNSNLATPLPSSTANKSKESIVLSNLAKNDCDGSKDETDGTVVKRDFKDNEVTLTGFVLKYTDDEREFFNIDYEYVSEHHPRFINSQLSSLLLKGEKVKVWFYRCGASGSMYIVYKIKSL